MEHQVTKAIEKVFCMTVNPQCICPASEDPGEWAPSAEVIIYHTNGMPSISRLNEWGQVSNELPGMHYVEAINNEVSAVFSL